MNLFLLLKTKEDILKNHGYQTFHSMKKKKEKNTLEVNGYQQLFGTQHPSKYLLSFITT